MLSLFPVVLVAIIIAAVPVAVLLSLVVLVV